MIAFDTNLLIYAHRKSSPEHAVALAAIENAISSKQCGIALPAIWEFWSIVTHPLSRGRLSTPADASTFIKNLIDDAGVQIWQSGADFARRLMQLATDLNISGVRIFDLQIALICFQNGATELWTHDKNFVTIPGLRLHDPVSLT